MIHKDNPVFSQIKEAQETDDLPDRAFNKFVGSLAIFTAVLLLYLIKDKIWIIT